MIEEWSSMSLGEKMKALIKEMTDEYYRVGKIDKIPEAIEIKKLLTSTTFLEFFRIALHSSIPYEHLETDIPPIGMGRMGGSIALGEEKAIVDCVSSNVSAIPLDELDFKNLIQDAYKKINNSIVAIFYPIEFFTQLHNEFDIKYINDFTVINTGIEEIKMIHSTNFSKWNQIVILGRDSIEWTRKLSFTPPPNLSDYEVFSREDEHFQSAYKMTTGEARFMIGTVSNCRIINTDNIIVYTPPSA